MKTLTLTAYWRSRDVTPGEFRETFPVRFDVRRYEQSPWVPPKLHEPRRYDDEYAAQLALGRIRRVIEFMDTSGLQPSTDLDRLFPLGRGLPNYAELCRSHPTLARCRETATDDHRALLPA